MAETSDSAVLAVSLKLPSFWSSQPAVWFAQAEAQFGLRKITDDSTRYYYVVSALDQDTAIRLTDLLERPPVTNKYEQLKNRLLSAFSLSRRERAAKLLRLRGLGDRKPSELMDEMLGLLGGHQPCFIFEQLFLEQMPEDIRIQLADADFSDPRKIALMADNLCIAKSVAHASDCFVSKIERHDVPRNSKQSQRLCFYHSKFGKAARKCQPPCTFAGNDSAGRQ